MAIQPRTPLRALPGSEVPSARPGMTLRAARDELAIENRVMRHEGIRFARLVGTESRLIYALNAQGQPLEVAQKAAGLHQAAKRRLIQLRPEGDDAA